MPWMPPAQHYLVVEWAPILEEYLTLAMVLLGLVLSFADDFCVRIPNPNILMPVEFVGSRNDKYVICA